MQASSFSVGNTISILAAVKRIMRSCGISPPSDLSNASDRTATAINAVDAAARRIFYAAHWSWRIHYGVESITPPATIQTSVLFRDLPASWHEAGGPATCNILPVPLENISFGRLMSIIPDLAASDAAIYTELPDVGEFVYEIDERHAGLPRYWGIYGESYFMYPLLTSEYFDMLDTDSEHLTIVFPFAAKYPSNAEAAIAYGTDGAVNIPESMSHILHHLALGYFQADQEFPGASANESRGERLLAEAVAKRRKHARDDSQIQNTSNRRAW